MTTRDGTCRVLIVEDHPTFADLMRQMVTLMGYEATVAHSLADARELDPADYHVVLCDYSLPDGTADDFLAEQSFDDGVPLVLLSGYNSEDLPPSVCQRFAACLTKPVDMADLKTVLTRLCPA